MDWENNFAQHILERGYDYYLSGSVKNLVVSGDSVQADVKGTENYEVEIRSEERRVGKECRL